MISTAVVFYVFGGWITAIWLVDSKRKWSPSSLVLGAIFWPIFLPRTVPLMLKGSSEALKRFAKDVKRMEEND